MNEKIYAVVYTGQLSQSLGRDTVISNLVLELGISNAKASALLDKPDTLLKRFESQSDAQRLADKLERAGLNSRLVLLKQSQAGAHQVSGESSLFSFFGSRPGKAGNESTLARMKKRTS